MAMQEAREIVLMDAGERESAKSSFPLGGAVDYLVNDTRLIAENH